MNTLAAAALVPVPSWAWACLVAPFIGSFLGVLVVRYDAVSSALMGRSACPRCGTRLGASELVPVMSWVVQSGRCRHCSMPISPFYPAIELAALAVAIWSASVFSGSALWASCLLGWTLVALAVTDLKYFRLPDFFTLPLTAAGLLWAAVLDNNSLADHAIGAVLGYAFVRLLRFAYRRTRGREGMGLGDAKLLAAAGAWVSWQGLPSVLMLASFLGLAGVLVQRLRGHRFDLARRVPFGAFLGAGLWLVWIYGPLAWEG